MFKPLPRLESESEDGARKGAVLSAGSRSFAQLADLVRSS